MEKHSDILNQLEDMTHRLIYMVKILRIKKANYLLNTNNFKKIVFTYYEKKRSRAMAIMREQKM
jgi:hypothetical protein